MPEAWYYKYDEDTGQYRIFGEGEKLICCVGNIAMSSDEKESLAARICRAARLLPELEGR